LFSFRKKNGQREHQPKLLKSKTTLGLTSEPQRLLVEEEEEGGEVETTIIEPSEQYQQERIVTESYSSKNTIYSKVF